MPEEIKAIGLHQQAAIVENAFSQSFPYNNTNEMATPINYWVVDVFDGYVIVSSDGNYYKVAFEMDGDKPVFVEKLKWEKVQEKREWVAAKSMKYGASISKKNREILKQVKELVSQLVPEEDGPAEEMTPAMMSKSADDMLISYGSAVKALPDGKIGGKPTNSQCLARGNV